MVFFTYFGQGGVEDLEMKFLYVFIEGHIDNELYISFFVNKLQL